MDDKETKKVSRRSFLKGVPLGIAGAFAISAVMGRFLPSRLISRRGRPSFPKDSIFRPADDVQA